MTASLPLLSPQTGLLQPTSPLVPSRLLNQADPAKLPLMQAEPGRRYLSISLPRLATDRIARLRHGQAWRLAAPPDAPPLVIAGRRSNALRLTALDEKADAAESPEVKS